ncbi:DUF6448 family protein [Neobacillus sp. FSL H8-0543]|uniref:DUF6448 family protein n=1 Tax=Neobacillus sp. FSL H8-0543 TaxID=2954672 RepID=UPI0031590B3E
MKFTMPKKIMGILIMALAIVAVIPTMASAHCDTMDGPVILDTKRAIEENNSSYILKWVLPEDEQEIKDAFELNMKVRVLGPDAQKLADDYLYNRLVRVHRAGEGAPFTGVKPEGTPMEEAIIAADKSIEAGNLSAFEGLIDEERMHGLEERFEKILATKDFDVNDVEAGREYVEAYVQFTHYAEGDQHEEGNANEHAEAVDHASEGQSDEQASAEESEVTHEKESVEVEKSSIWIPWSLAGLFLLTTVVAHFRRHKH